MLLRDLRGGASPSAAPSSSQVHGDQAVRVAPSNSGCSSVTATAATAQRRRQQGGGSRAGAAGRRQQGGSRRAAAAGQQQREPHPVAPLGALRPNPSPPPAPGPAPTIGSSSLPCAAAGRRTGASPAQQPAGMRRETAAARLPARAASQASGSPGRPAAAGRPPLRPPGLGPLLLHPRRRRRQRPLCCWRCRRCRRPAAAAGVGAGGGAGAAGCVPGSQDHQNPPGTNRSPIRRRRALPAARRAASPASAARPQRPCPHRTPAQSRWPRGGGREGWEAVAQCPASWAGRGVQRPVSWAAGRHW